MWSSSTACSAHTSRTTTRGRGSTGAVPARARRACARRMRACGPGRCVCARPSKATMVRHLQHFHMVHGCFACFLSACAVQVAAWHASCARMLAHGHATSMSQLRPAPADCSIHAHQAFTRVTHSPEKSAAGSRPRRHRCCDLAQLGAGQPQPGAGAQPALGHFTLTALPQPDGRADRRAVCSRCVCGCRRWRAMAAPSRCLMLRVVQGSVVAAACCTAVRALWPSLPVAPPPTRHRRYGRRRREQDAPCQGNEVSTRPSSTLCSRCATAARNPRDVCVLRPRAPGSRRRRRRARAGLLPIPRAGAAALSCVHAEPALSPSQLAWLGSR